MSSYRLLTDHYVNGRTLEAGSVQVTQDASASGALPADWLPTPDVEPLDSAAVSAFYAAGPRPLDLVRTVYYGRDVLLPTTFWSPVPGTGQWQLTGLGAGLPPVNPSG